MTETVEVKCTTCGTHFDADMNRPGWPAGTIAISLKPCPRCGDTGREVITGRGLDEARERFEREARFAAEAHEFTSDVQEGVAVIFGDTAEAERTAWQYTKAAQLIACTRGTCGGPSLGHEHLSVAPR